MKRFVSLNLATKQNADTNIRRLAAQSYLYTTAKWLNVAEFLLAAALPVVAGIVAFFAPDSHTLFSIVSFFCWWVVFLLEPLRKSYCKKAASIQESLDTELLALPRNNRLEVSDVKIEDIVLWSDRIIEKDGDEKFRSWYPEVSDELPAPVGRIICQRANLWWDESVRRRYVQGCTVLKWILLSLWLVVGLVFDLSVRTAVVNFLLPIGPLVFFLAKEARANSKVIHRKNRLLAETENLWTTSLSNPDSDELCVGSRELQDLIFALRCEATPVWQWLHKLTRKKNEALMIKTAEERVAEAKRKLSI